MGSGSLTTNLEFFEEELNTGVGWGRGQIKVGVGVIDNSFGIYRRGVEHRCRLGSGPLTTNLEFIEEELNTDGGWGRSQIKVGVGVIDK